MSQQLITIKNLSGINQARVLDINATLSATRVLLSGLEKPLMASTDTFLTEEKVEIAKEGEPFIKVSDITVKNTLHVGNVSDLSTIDPNDDVQRYNLLNITQKRDIFKNIQIFRGLTFTKNGFSKTFNDVYGWKGDNMPNANMPTVITEKTSHMHFSEVVHQLTVSGSRSTSVSFDSPFASADAEYKYEKDKTTGSSTIKEYLTDRFVVRKVDLRVNLNNLTVNENFVKAIKASLSQQGSESSFSTYEKLINILNEWGYYVPLQFTLGGVLYSTDSTTITKYEEALKEKQEFSGSFKANFKKIGGGAAYSQSNGTESSDSTTNKYKDTAILQIGGEAGLSGDYEKWAASLKPAINWNLAENSKLLPSLYLLLFATNKPEGFLLLGTCLRLINDNLSLSNKLQPYLNMGKYSNEIEVLVNPFG